MMLFRSKQVRPGSAFVPRLEALENRWVPSASISFNHGVLTINDNTAAAMIKVTDDGAGGITVTDANISSTPITHSEVKKIEIDSGADDTINYKLTGALTTARTLELNLGAGGDKVNLDLSKGVSSDFSLDLDGGKGANIIDADFGAVHNANVHLDESLGKGTGGSTSIDFASTITNSRVFADIDAGRTTAAVHATFKGDITNSNVHLDANLGHLSHTVGIKVGGNIQGKSHVGFDIDTGNGNDTVNFTAGGVAGSKVNIDAKASLSLQLDGHKGNKHFNVSYDGVLKGRLGIDLDGTHSNNTSTANITVEKGSTGRLFASELAGTGTNVLTLNVNDLTGSPSTLHKLHAVINANHGTSTIVHTPNVTVHT
jgi:hypothetical protein